MAATTRENPYQSPALEPGQVERGGFDVRRAPVGRFTAASLFMALAAALLCRSRGMSLQDCLTVFGISFYAILFLHAITFGMLRTAVAGYRLTARSIRQLTWKRP